MRNNFTIVLNIVCRLDTNNLRKEFRSFRSRRYLLEARQSDDTQMKKSCKITCFSRLIKYTLTILLLEE